MVALITLPKRRHGGYTVSRRLSSRRFYRDAKITQICGGTTEIKKNIIARELQVGA